MFNSLFDLVKDTTRIVAAPIEATVAVVAAPVKIVADAVEELADDVKQAVKPD